MKFYSRDGYKRILQMMREQQTPPRQNIHTSTGTSPNTGLPEGSAVTSLNDLVDDVTLTAGTGITIDDTTTPGEISITASNTDYTIQYYSLLTGKNVSGSTNYGMSLHAEYASTLSSPVGISMNNVNSYDFATSRCNDLYQVIHFPVVHTGSAWQDRHNLVINTGFKQIKPNIKIGIMIREGYWRIVDPLASAYIMVGEYGSSTNQVLQSFSPSSSWAEYSLTTTRSAIGGTDNDLYFAVEFKPTSNTACSEPGYTLEFKYIYLMQW